MDEEKAKQLTNNELVLTEIMEKLFPKELDLNDCVRFPNPSGGYVFFDPKTTKVTEIAVEDGFFKNHSYFFNRQSSGCVRKSIVNNRYICIDWDGGEILVLSYLLDQHGLSNYVIKDMPYKENRKVSTHYAVYEMLFTDEADAAMFELYFNNLFREHEDDEFIKEIVEKDKVFS